MPKKNFLGINLYTPPYLQKYVHSDLEAQEKIDATAEKFSEMLKGLLNE